MDSIENSGGNAPRECARDRLRDEIVRRILNGDYEAGAHLKELVLAREFGVSQAPVREALRELEMLGLVVSERYCGTRVLPCGSADLREAYELKAVIERTRRTTGDALRSGGYGGSRAGFAGDAHGFVDR